MVLARILEVDDYDPELRRFKSCAFTRSSSDKAYSAFDLECANNTSGSPCQHIARFYPNTIPPLGGPVYFWTFDTAALPPPKAASPNKPASAAPRAVQSVSTTGDACHHGIVDFPESAAKNFFKKGHFDSATKTFLNVFRCSDAGLQQINTVADIPELQTGQ
jgi:hypothetical protein